MTEETNSSTDSIRWASKVSRKDIQRLYLSDAEGKLDETLLEKVLYCIHNRILDMLEVREAQTFGRVICRRCGAQVSQIFMMGPGNRQIKLICDQCGWETTCGDFFKSYSGKDLLPGSRVDLFQEFLTRFPQAVSPQEKMLLIDWLIHEFHGQSGVARRLVAMNVIQGSREQLVEMFTALAVSENMKTVNQAFLIEEDSPVRRFRRLYPSRAKVLEVAARLGISNRTRMQEKDLILEILRLAPELLDQSSK